MEIARASIKTYSSDYPSVVPVVIPDLDDVRRFAARLHARGRGWNGEAFGWPAEYNPERPEPPLDSNMTFTPADFCIGESGIWFYSLMWEHGSDAEPVEFLDDESIVKVLAEPRAEKFLAAMAKVADVEPPDERDRWTSAEAYHLPAVLAEPKVAYETQVGLSKMGSDDEKMMTWTRVTFDPKVMGGKPCIRGMRVTVGMIVGLVAAGYSTEEILAAYPYLEAADVREALNYAAWRVEEREYPLVAA